MGIYVLIAVGVVVLIVLAALVKVLEQSKAKGSEGASAGPLPYHAKDYLFTQAERRFLDALDEAVGGNHRVFAKVRLADLVFMPKGTDGRQGHQNKVNMKHIDFVVCERRAMKPVVAVELDDSSHQREDRVRRDDFVNRALEAAGLPLVRVRAAASYDPAQIRHAILNGATKPVTAG